MSEKNPFIEPLFDDSSPPNSPDLAENFHAHKQTEFSDGEKFVVFFLDDELFALPAERVAEIVRPPAFTPLPNSPGWLHGIANLRGEVISVVNLSKICGKPGAGDSSKSRLIVLKPATFAASAAFPVDRLCEIVALRAAHIEPAVDFHLSGRARYKTFSINLLDAEKIFSSLSLG